MIRRPPRSTQSRSSAASDVYKRQRQGLRTFTTSYYLSPGRMNLIAVSTPNGTVDVVVDYCHNAPGMRELGDFVERFSEQRAGATDLAKPSRIGIIATAGDRRDDDMRELGRIAAELA